MKLSTLFSRVFRPAFALGVLALLFASLSRAQTPLGRYTVAAGVVTDTQTGLEWQQTDDGNSYTFAAAPGRCTGLGTGWRVPSMKELQTIVDESLAYPAVDKTVFTSIPSGNGLPSCYETSTQLAGSTLGWLVCFDTGRATYDSASDAYRVLCVH